MEERVKEPFGIVLVPTEAGRALLYPGAPVYSVRDMLHGWVVEATNGNACVHAPTEGDGHVHDMERDVWALELWRAGALVPEGWDRARRVASDLHPAWMMPTIMEPGADQLLMVARFLEKHRLCRVMLLDLVDGAVVERAP